MRTISSHAHKCGVVFVVIQIVAIAWSNSGVRAADTQPTSRRPRIGVAFGGGSARGLAHVGVIRWFEEHHIPIDLIAGTSMGGLVGGAYASGMSSQELAQLLATTNWDEMFKSTGFRYKNVRRKADARDFPSRIEFGLKHGIVPPTALNNGQQVDFLLQRIGGAYLQLRSFDDLPTPFRCLATDLVSAQSIVLDHGSLPAAMRATMSLPGLFPPIELDGQVLVDGGALNNVPANVVRDMGADVVVAVNVGYEGETRTVNYSLLGLISQTVDVMMDANTRAAMLTADIVINPPLKGFGSLDWRRSEELAEVGYRAAEALKDKLLPLAIDEQAWAAYQTDRQTRRRSQLPTPKFLNIVDAASSDQRRMEELLKPFIGKPLNVAALEKQLETFTGLDRYEVVDWQIIEENGQPGLQIHARPKAYAPPFLMLGINMSNITSDAFAVQFAGRYLTFDVLGSGSELRVDAAVGALPRIGAELYRPLGKTPLFVTASALAIGNTLNFIRDDVVVAQYHETNAGGGLGGGVNLGREDEVRVSVTAAHLSASVVAGDPGLPELSGLETRTLLRWLHDGQDSPVVPSTGVHATATLSHIFDSPAPPSTITTTRTNMGLTQAEGVATAFWSLRGLRDRVFLAGGAGTSFDGKPLPTDQFQLGRPFRLSAYDLGELRGDHYIVASAGYLRGVGKLPDFIGGPFFVGGWLENGSAFDSLDTAKDYTNVGVGAILDTLVGPVIVGASFSFDGRSRYYISIGRLF
jgi:NTE family protein